MMNIGGQMITNNYNILLIGDVHGNTGAYKALINNHTGDSIQLGDFGFKKEHMWHLRHIDNRKHKIIFGNHDFYPFLTASHNLKDWTFLHDNKILAIRGAHSIDSYMRIEGRDWFENEELTYGQLNCCLDEYEKYKPEIVLTHTCPQIITEMYFNIYDKTTTGNGLQAMFEIHKPKLWIFGHHHKDLNETVLGTQFICLSELKTLII